LRQHLRKIQALQGVLLHHADGGLGEVSADVAEPAGNARRRAAQPCRALLAVERIEHAIHSLLRAGEGEAQAISVSPARTAGATRTPAAHTALALFTEH